MCCREKHERDLEVCINGMILSLFLTSSLPATSLLPAPARTEDKPIWLLSPAAETPLCQGVCWIQDQIRNLWLTLGERCAGISHVRRAHELPASSALSSWHAGSTGGSQGLGCSSGSCGIKTSFAAIFRQRNEVESQRLKKKKILSLPSCLKRIKSNNY